MRDIEQQPLRIVARPLAGTGESAVGAAAEHALAGITWSNGGLRSVERLGVDVIIEVTVPEPIGSDLYASHAWELCHLLQDTALFESVEADVPVEAFDPGLIVIGAFGVEDCTTVVASEPHDWALRAMHWDEAVAILEAEGRLPDPAKPASGIRIGHPDSGFTDHPALGPVVDETRDWDAISGDDDAHDPLGPPKRSYFNLLPNPGHGTSTASVLLGLGDGLGFHGSGLGASLVPYRATESVVQFFDSDVAKSVRRAREAGCHIVSMSLGGTGFRGLKDAIQDAVDDGMIVMAAAGNQVRVVTAPAYYANCLAVAGTGPGGEPWTNSSRGDAVDVAAPGACVWAALFTWKTMPPGMVVARSNGTSYSVAHLAGVAALWLKRWGHDELCTAYGRRNIQKLFLHQLNQPGVCTRTPDWNDDWGVGQVDAAALLSQALPSAAELEGVAAFGAGAGDDPVERLAAIANVSPNRVLEWLDQRPQLRDSLDRYEGELAYLLMQNPSLHASLASPGLGAFGAFGAAPVIAASPQLAAIFD